jgi:hypothetical protein
MRKILLASRITCVRTGDRCAILYRLEKQQRHDRSFASFSPNPIVNQNGVGQGLPATAVAGRRCSRRKDMLNH